MSTRGTIGFVINGEEKLGYNHMDSYPSGMGVEVLAFLREVPLEKMKEKASALQVVDDDVPATREQILALRETTSWNVNQYSMAGPQPEDVSPTSPDGLPDTNVGWYNLLRATQGDLKAILEAGYMEDGHLFPLDSLFCEWAYVIDLDAEVLEVYEGFQKRRPKHGRWAGRPTDAENRKNHRLHLARCKEQGREPWEEITPQYKAVELVASYSLTGTLPSDEVFVAEVDPREEEK